MKTTISVLLVASICLPVVGQGLLLTPGDSFSYVFDSFLPLSDAPSGVFPAELQVHFANDLFGPGDSIRLEMFEDNPAANAFAFRTFAGTSTDVSSLTLSAGAALPDAWQDRQGAVRVTMIEGSAELERILVAIKFGNDIHGQIVTVPEPGSLSLLLLGGLGSGLLALTKGRTRGLGTI